MKNTKICKKCGRELPLSEFSKHKITKDGYRNICKECCSKYMKEYFAEHNERKKQYDKQWRSFNSQYIKSYKKEWLNTQKGRAYNLLAAYKQSDRKYGRENNIDTDWIVENIFTQKCPKCGETDWRKLGCDRIDNTKGHTKDNVVPCCEKCNKERHRKSFDEFYD